MAGMAFNIQRRKGVILISCVLGLAGAARGEGLSAAADDSGYWRLVVSPYTHHWRYSVEHKKVWAVGAERQLAGGWLVGGSYFNNSFGQPSSYVYLGRRHPGLLGVEPLYAQWSVGVLYGYVGKYKTKVPLNYAGFAPGAVISLGWQATREASAQFNLLGDAGVMFQFNYAWQ